MLRGRDVLREIRATGWGGFPPKFHKTGRVERMLDRTGIGRDLNVLPCGSYAHFVKKKLSDWLDPRAGECLCSPPAGQTGLLAERLAEVVPTRRNDPSNGTKPVADL